MVIAIDGPAGAGKSTVARAVADALGYRYLDTGAMYRAVTLAALRAGVDSDDPAGLAALAGLAATMTDDLELRSPEVEQHVSLVARHLPVREALHGAQRAYLAEGDVVAEGRDVGGVVWPEAELKIWLDAEPDVRARRGRDRQHRARPGRGRRPHRRAGRGGRAMSDVPADSYRIITPDRFWGFWRLLLQRPFTWFFRMRVYGAEHVPRTGPAVIASNHIAGIDVVVLGAASPRTLRYMAKAELFTYNRILAWLLRRAGAFGVRRGESDLEALRLARRVLRAGHPLGVFCEGTRQPSEAIGPVQPGAALIALSEGAPIVPVVIQGTIFIKQRRRHPVTVMFGAPLPVEQTAQRGQAYREAVVATTAELQRELERLQRRTQAAIAAGRPRDLAGVDAGGMS